MGFFLWLLFGRNYWVLEVRIHLLKTDFQKFKKLPCYETMLFKFWIWNVEKFLEL